MYQKMSEKLQSGHIFAILLCKIADFLCFYAYCSNKALTNKKNETELIRL